jgi:drug/metabolite transporter (DMT)-like permease
MVRPWGNFLLGDSRDKKVELLKGQTLFGAILYGALAMGISFSLIYWLGISKDPGQHVSILMATVPLLTLFFSTLYGLEAFRTRGLIWVLDSFGHVIRVRSHPAHHSRPGDNTSRGTNFNGLYCWRHTCLIRGVV